MFDFRIQKCVTVCSKLIYFSFFYSNFKIGITNFCGQNLIACSEIWRFPYFKTWRFKISVFYSWQFFSQKPTNSIKLHQMIKIFYATDTYIMHFLEPTRFLNAPDLAGCKVNVLYDPGLAKRPTHSSCLNTCGCLGPAITTLFLFA